MVSFTLFTPQLLAIKLQAASSSQIIALLAAMFSFSARFRSEKPTINGDAAASEQQATWPDANKFYQISKNSVDGELMDLKSSPELILLQAVTLLSFHELIESAEGRGWRSLGPLVRIAYELRLHLVDKNVRDISTDDPDLWSAKEERRRTWWAIWEMDVFTSTVRRLPSAIDWNQNWTVLPVDDEFWLQKKPKTSCYLAADPMERFKLLQNCSNLSAKAWFIVANSLMRTAYCVSNSQEYFWTPPSFNTPRPGRETLTPLQITAQIRNAHDILNNSIYCFSVALPRNLRYQGQHLFSNVALASKSTKQRDSDIYSIYIMVRLADFMLNDPNTRETASKPAEPDSSFSKQFGSSKTLEGQQGRELDRILTKYISMAQEILAIVRNSGPNHVHLVNPFLASTVWLAAAVFLVYKYLGISDESSQEHLLVESNVVLLKAVFRQFVQWWGMSDILETKLSELETELVRMRKIGSAASIGSQQHSPSKEGQENLPKSFITNSYALHSSENSCELGNPVGTPVSATSQMGNSKNPPRNTDALDQGAFPSFMQNIESLSSAYEPGSGLYNDGFHYDVELQGFLDSMFATFRGQDDVQIQWYGSD